MTTPITVIGGSYGEECAFPRSIVYRGSGVRAASVLAGFGNNVTLNTVTGPVLRREFSDICKRKGIALNAATSNADVWFRYRHPLSMPDIHPCSPLVTSEREPISTERALVFGMIEDRQKVIAERAVYDPQDGYRAKPFSENGSSANELVLLASLSEGRALTGERLPEDVAAKLLSSPACVAAVVKCGPRGALVATANTSDWIGAFPSSRMWKIGSGDVFSAAFTHKWFANNCTVLDAAWFASRTVAEYVSTRQETFGPDRMAVISSDAAAAAESDTSRQPVRDARIYLAGPFFTTAQQWIVDETRSALQDLGFNVFSPIHEIGEGPSHEVAPADIFALEQSDLVFALIDGLDAGTMFEIGYARARNIPVVCLAECADIRSLTMMLGSGCEVFNDFATSIYAACWQLIHHV